MPDLIIKKNGTDYKLPMLAEHYPADRVYLDGDINKTVQDAISDFDVLWTGDAHAYNDELNLAHPISDYKKIMFVLNVIPNRSPDYDVPADCMYYPAIQTGSAWDISCFAGCSIKQIGLTRVSDTKLKVSAYVKDSSMTSYNPGICKIIGFKCV